MALFKHEDEMAELEAKGITVGKLPKSIQAKIMSFGKIHKVYAELPEGEEKTDRENEMRKYSIIIADELISFDERDLPDDEEPNNPNNMNAELIARAKAVNLPETATEQEVVAAETEAAAKTALAQRAVAVGLAETATEEEIVAAEKAKAEPPAGDPPADDAAKAAAAEKEKADKEAGDKAAKEKADKEKAEKEKKGDIYSFMGL